jgi:hypothetical protein
MKFYNIVKHSVKIGDTINDSVVCNILSTYICTHRDTYRRIPLRANQYNQVQIYNYKILTYSNNQIKRIIIGKSKRSIAVNK